MKQFRYFTCLYTQNSECEFPKYEEEPTAIDLNAIVAFNKGDDNTTTVRFSGGETLRVKMKYEHFCKLMAYESMQVMNLNTN